MEFVVGNKTVAKLMKLEGNGENPFYEPIVRRSLEMLFDTQVHALFDYKGGCLNCYAGRPTEFDKQADAVGNWVVDGWSSRRSIIER